jgi:hypothetical protein
VWRHFANRAHRLANRPALHEHRATECPRGSPWGYHKPYSVAKRAVVSGSLIGV